MIDGYLPTFFLSFSCSSWQCLRSLTVSSCTICVLSHSNFLTCSSACSSETLSSEDAWCRRDLGKECEEQMNQASHSFCHLHTSSKCCVRGPTIWSIARSACQDTHIVEWSMGGQYVMNNLLSLSPPHFLPFSLSSLLPLLPLPPSLILSFPLISLSSPPFPPSCSSLSHVHAHYHQVFSTSTTQWEQECL